MALDLAQLEWAHQQEKEERQEQVVV